MTPIKPCLCNEPLCRKCLVSNCEDDNCKIHTLIQKLKAKRDVLKNFKNANIKQFGKEISRLENLKNNSI